MKKKIPVVELQFGMYVWELDRPWTETPFMFQGFVLESAQQMEALKKYCKHVFIDTEKADSAAPRRQLHPGAGPLATDLPGTGKVVHAESASVQEEMPQARAALKEAQFATVGLFDAIRVGDMLEAGEARTAVGNMTVSMLRNPDALTLFAAMRERGGYQLERAMDVSVYMIVFARFLGMEEDDVERAGLVGLLQDIGMLQLPSEMLQKPGRLEPAEYKIVQGHVERTSKVLAGAVGLPTDVAKLAALHHERFEGTGYPRGLRGPAISVIGAMAGIVDTFDALTVKRPYAEPLSPSNALNLLFRMRGKTFHPVLVEQFIRCIGYFPVGSVVELNSGEIGVVVSQNAEQRLQPRVMVVRDAAGQPLRPQKLLNLAKLPKMSADEPYRIRRTLEYGRAGVTLNEILMGD
jgi:HD-GYP domain-containing protein (c-di-GMP phosphodiesterase class II)